MNTGYFFTDKINSNPDHLFDFAFTWLTDSINNEEAILHIPLLTHLDGMLESFLGEKETRQLRNKKEIRINNVIVHLSTDKNITYFQNPVRIFAYLAKSSQMDKIESRYNQISKILAVPWLDDDLDNWKETRRAEKIE